MRISKFSRDIIAKQSWKKHNTTQNIILLSGLQIMSLFFFFLFYQGRLLDVLLYNIYEVLTDLPNKLIFLLAVDDSHGLVPTAQHHRLGKQRLAYL